MSWLFDFEKEVQQALNHLGTAVSFAKEHKVQSAGCTWRYGGPYNFFRRAWNAGQIVSSYLLSKLTGRVRHWGLPLALSFEPTTSCNLRCPECPSGLRSFTRPTGMLPAELQLTTLYSAGVTTSAREPEAAKALIGAMIAPSAAPIYKASGLDPAR